MIFWHIWYLISSIIYPILNLGPNSRIWTQIGPKIAYFNKYRWFKAEKSSVDGYIGFLGYNDIFLTYLISIIIYPILNLGPNPRFWAQIGLKIAYFNRYWYFGPKNGDLGPNLGLVKWSLISDMSKIFQNIIRTHYHHISITIQL